jgi:phosphoribosylformylglycinamidine synthase
MNSYEIMLSESQERMLVIVQRGREREIEEVFAKWDLHAARVGEVTDTGRMVVRQHGVVVADIPAPALTDDAPVYQRQATRPSYLDETSRWTAASGGLPDLDAKGALGALPRLLSHPTIASKRWIYRQYDHMVQHGTVVLPGSDAGVVRLRLGGREKFIAISNDCNGRYCYLNPRRGAMIAMVECLRNLVCAGATPLAMTDNLNFGNPYKPENFYQLRECVAGLAEACTFFDVPVVGGNVSLYNESPEGAIDPTPTVSVVGFIEEEAHVTRQFAGAPGERIVLLGGAPDELGGSQFLGVVHGLKTGDAPRVDLAGERRLQDLLLGQIRAGRVRAAHDLSEGGLLVALCEMLFGAEGLGASVDLAPLGAARLDALLFGESQGRVLLCVAAADEAAVAAAALAAGVRADPLGEVTGDGTLSAGTALGRLEWDVRGLRKGWEGSIEAFMKRPGID